MRPARVFMACLAVALAATAFRIAGVALPPVVVPAVFAIACVARLQNDWRDRRHDRRKGRHAAWARPGAFLACLLGVWAVCCALIAVAAVQNLWLGALLAAMALAALLYSEIRRIPWAPLATAAVTSAAPAVLPVALHAGDSRPFVLAAAAGLLIAAREILKDIEDCRIDPGYKWTVPVALGETAGRRLACAGVMAGGALAVVVAPLAALAAPAFLVGGRRLLMGAAPPPVMACLDAGAVVALAALGLS